MRLSHTAPVAAARFDEPNLVSSAGVVPVMRLAADAGLGKLSGRLLTVPTDKGANSGGKVTALVCGMVAGADSIDDMALLRHGAMGRLFNRAYAPSTLGSFLREFRFGHVRQLDAVASQFLTALAARTPLLAGSGGPQGLVFVDIDDSIIEVHGHAKQGAAFGYTRVRGLNMLLATASTSAASTATAAGGSAPVVLALRRGWRRPVPSGSSRWTARSWPSPLIGAKLAGRSRSSSPTSTHCVGSLPRRTREAGLIADSLAVALRLAADPFAPLRSMPGTAWRPGRIDVEHLPAKAVGKR